MNLVKFLFVVLWHFLRFHHVQGYETSESFEAYCNTCRHVIGVAIKD